MKKNLFLTFCYSLVPGAGQMYQGFMKRGVSIMILFMSVIALAAMIGAPVLVLPLPVIFAYSFFDTFNIRNKVNENLKDEYIWNNVDEFKKIGNIKEGNKGRIIGILFIVLGIYLMLNTVVLRLVSRYDIVFLEIAVRTFLQYFPPILIAISCVYMGIKLVNRK